MPFIADCRGTGFCRNAGVYINLFALGFYYPSVLYFQSIHFPVGAVWNMNDSKYICKHPDNIYQNKNGNVNKNKKAYRNGDNHIGNLKVFHFTFSGVDDFGYFGIFFVR